MPTLFKIPDSDFQDAARGVASFRVNESNVNAADIEKVIRAYVDLGQNKQIQDWYYSLSEPQKDAIVKAVQAKAKGFFSAAPDYGRTYNTFDTLDTMASYGGVNEAIIRPRKWQENFERTVAEANKNTTSPLQKAVEDVFGGLFSALKNIFAGIAKALGLDPGMVTVILIIFLLITFSSFLNFRTT